jgi:hypothetical protein
MALKYQPYPKYILSGIGSDSHNNGGSKKEKKRTRSSMELNVNNV